MLLVSVVLKAQTETSARVLTQQICLGVESSHDLCTALLGIFPQGKLEKQGKERKFVSLC